MDLILAAIDGRALFFSGERKEVGRGLVNLAASEDSEQVTGTSERA